MVTVAHENIYTFLPIFTPTDVGVFLLKMCKLVPFSILEDFTWADGDALTMGEGREKEGRETKKVKSILKNE